jgi:hypothetical protein
MAGAVGRFGNGVGLTPASARCHFHTGRHRIAFQTSFDGGRLMHAATQLNVVMSRSSISGSYDGTSRNRYLRNTLMPLDEIGHRIGVTGVDDSRKAFRPCTSKPPSAYRLPGGAK